MSTDALIEKIHEDANAEIERINAQTEARCAEIEKETRQKKNELTQEYEARLEDEKKEAESRARAKAAHENRIEIAHLKREALDSIFAEAHSTLSEANDEEYAAILSELVSSLPPDFNGTCVAPSKRIDITRSTLSSAGITPSDIKESPTLSGGVICTDEVHRYDLSFESFIRSLQERLEADIARTLFS